jgi:pyruvate/2-oxoglutarate/acetoin dehydrogenase E1 component
MIAEKGFDYLDAPIKRVTAMDCPVPFSPPLEKAVVPGDPAIERAVREVMG